MLNRCFGHLATKDLVAIGIFSCLAKMSGLAVALAGGGMNPVTLALRNAIVSGLMIVLLAKVGKGGTLFLSALLGGIVSLLMFGHGLMLLPGALLGGLAGEGCMRIFRTSLDDVWLAVAGVACAEIVAKTLSMCVMYLALRENPALFVPLALVIGAGGVGTLLGLVGGKRMIGELRHAGIL